MRNGPRAVQRALTVIRAGRNLSLQATLDLEQRTAVDLIASGECLHGIGAFLTGQTPDFPDLSPEGDGRIDLGAFNPLFFPDPKNGEMKKVTNRVAPAKGGGFNN